MPRAKVGRLYDINGLPLITGGSVSFANDDNGNAAVAYIEVTLGSNAGSGFQQQIVFDANSFASSYFATNLVNINFQDGAGNLIYSWQETHLPTSSSTSVIYWVKLPNGSITNLYMVLVGTSDSSYSTSHTGVEPTYSATYAQYDNGASVFGTYTNFPGASLPAGWSSVGSSVTQTVNNGITLGSNSQTSFGGIEATSSNSDGIAMDVLAEFTSSSSPLYYAIVGWLSASLSFTNALVMQSGENSVAGGINSLSGGNQTADDASSFPYSSKHIFSLAWISSTSAIMDVDYSSVASVSSNVPTSSLYQALAIEEALGETNSLFVQWIRTRTYASMPSVSFGSLTAITTLSLSPGTGDAGTSVTLSGSGYTPSTTYQAAFSTSDSSFAGGFPATVFTTDGSGNIPSGTTITVPDYPAGTLYVVIETYP